MNKKIIFLGVFLIICFGTAFSQFNKIIPGKKIEQASLISIKQAVGGKKKNEQIKIGATALQLLNSTHVVVTKGEKENAFITSIDGRAADSQKREFWAFYVNGKQAQVGAGSYFVKKNDTIEWKIETY